MEYKLSNKYLSNNNFNRAVSGLTGLALLVSTSGCIDTINGVRLKDIRILIKGGDNKPKNSNGKELTIKTPVGTPSYSNPSTNTHTADVTPPQPQQGFGGWMYENKEKILIGTAIVGAIGVGTYFLIDQLGKDSKKDDDVQTVFGGNGPGGPGGGPGTGGPGGN